MLIITILTLFFIFSISIVSAEENSSTDFNIPKKSVSKDFNFFDLFNWGNEKKYGYWVLSEDMNKINFDKLSDDGVDYIFLNSFAFTQHGEKNVLKWIKEANDHGIEVHIWMQIFYEGEWVSPVKKGVPNVEYFNKKIDEGKYYAGLEGVSGIQIDYIRFEGNAYSYKNGTESINLFIKNFTESIRKVNPDLTLSATVMPEGEKNSYYYGQDIKEISKYVDIIVPMIYKGNYYENSTWIKNTTEWYVNNSGDARVWCGIQTYKSDFNVTDLSSGEMMKDANYCFDGGTDCVVFFRWGLNEDLDNKKLK